MYIKVRFLNGFTRRLTYKVPDHISGIIKNAIVSVPLRKRYEFALVDEIFMQSPDSGFVIKEISALSALPNDPSYQPFIEQLSAYHAVDPFVLYQRLTHFLEEQEENIAAQPTEQVQPLITQLTEEQQAVVDHVAVALENPHFQPTLLHGVTGSGKTEVYKKLIVQAFEQKKTTLLLLPEISLAVRFAHILRQQLPSDIPIFSFHSATSVKEKRALWQQLLENNPVLIIGVHQPIMLPLPQLGLIIIDEEHDHNFQEKRHPKINTKEAAIMRAQVAKIPILLGSATPSLNSLYNVQAKNWHIFTIKQRFAGAFPVVKTVRLVSGKRPQFWISKELQTAITDRLYKKEQVIIFINRRGYSFFVQCKECSFIATCMACSVSLTLHEDQTVRCHYCGHVQKSPSTCSACKAPEKSLLKKGIGTQQVVAILQKLFPPVKIARADLDTTINKKKWEATIQAFGRGEFDIIVGTQTITKGYHFPQVTLVGVIWADLHLSLPVYHAAETTVQQLIQVAGRAGRQSNDSLVIIQTLIDHPAFSFLNEQDYATFYDYEMKYRRELNYPPCIRLAELELRHEDEAVVQADAQRCAQALKKWDIHNKLLILGPAQPPVHKIKNVHIRKIYLKAVSAWYLCKAYEQSMALKMSAQIFFTQNPL